MAREPILHFLLFFTSTSFFFLFSFATDILTPSQPLSNGETLISKNKTFALGFFTPPNSTNTYLAIWFHNITDHTVVWVANRQNPITNLNATLSITPSDASLHITTSTNSAPLWSSPSFPSSISNPIAQLLDTGNLLIKAPNSTSHLWQSFDHPTDTMLSGMNLGPELKTGIDRNLTSWLSKSDPSQGKYVFAIDPIGVPQAVIRDASGIWIWRGGPWNGYCFSAACPKEMFSTGNYRDYGQNFNSTADEIDYYFNAFNGAISMLSLDENGVLRHYQWKLLSQKWNRVLLWLAPSEACDFFAACGTNAICNSSRSPMCQCFDGFGPRNPVRWKRGDWSDGCVRVVELGCGANGTDEFMVVRSPKLPDTREAVEDRSLGSEECKTRCLMNCSCQAYATLYLSGSSGGCIIWLAEVRDLGGASDNFLQDLYVRVASPLRNGSNGRKKKKTWVFVVIPVATMLFLLMILMGTFIIKRRNHKDEEQSIPSRNWDLEIMHELDANKEGNSEISFFKFTQLMSATNSFADVNKLGEGGFGSVYKGKLPDGQEVAIKRLSTRSGQGLAEFKNEIILIAKLQHRNLVRLLGCCIHGEEKMLIYEYMPNKSLDLLLFDVKQRLKLSWTRRIQIIEGIAQGLLYLHKHSRLRIIHRDLKASNILLDADMNPKISDFGMARIFDSNDTQANTQRIVGTFGYMSPEYALNGIFSVKSDVYSFGVLLLEIVSGKKNYNFHEFNPWCNLLTYAWGLWKEGTWKKLIDPSLENKFQPDDVARCIYVALLCVQERPEDRPFMSDVATMLNSQSLCFNSVKKPAFFTIENASDSERRSNQYKSNCSNDLSISALTGR